MSRARSVALIALFAFLVGCGSMAARQHKEAEARAARLGHPEVSYTESVSPGTAFALGFLPFGVAGLYVGDSKLAASGLLWPFSIIWVPQRAYDRAVDANDRDFESRMMSTLEGTSTP